MVQIFEWSNVSGALFVIVYSSCGWVVQKLPSSLLEMRLEFIIVLSGVFHHVVKLGYFLQQTDG